MNIEKSLLAVLLLALAGTAAADEACVPVAPWTQSVTDSLSQTTYSITAPDCVYLTQPFDVTLTVTDAVWTFGEVDVGWGWKVLDNAVVVESGAGLGWITLVDGVWTRTFTWTYVTPPPIDHTIEFAFNDLGDGNGAHSWAGSVIGAVTVDPLPPVGPPPVEPPPVDPPVVEPPVVDPPAADPATDPATGCATGGGEAGLLAFIALALGARRRRA
jgi:hypothetical protein